MKTIIQIPVEKKMRDAFEVRAHKNGFSSIQDALRLFMQQYIERKINVGFTEPPVRLSKKNASRYEKMMKDFESGKNISVAHSVDEFIKQLNA